MLQERSRRQSFFMERLPLIIKIIHMDTIFIKIIILDSIFIVIIINLLSQRPEAHACTFRIKTRRQCASWTNRASLSWKPASSEVVAPDVAFSSDQGRKQLEETLFDNIWIFEISPKLCIDSFKAMLATILFKKFKDLMKQLNGKAETIGYCHFILKAP